MDTVNKFGTFLLLSFLILPGIADAAGQDFINSQLQNSSVVYLPAGTYVLTDSIILQSNSVLEGEPETVITIPDNVGWPAWKPLISGIGKYNITLRNLEIYGNADNQNYVPVCTGIVRTRQLKDGVRGITTLYT